MDGVTCKAYMSLNQVLGSTGTAGSLLLSPRLALTSFFLRPGIIVSWLSVTILSLKLDSSVVRQLDFP